MSTEDPRARLREIDDDLARMRDDLGSGVDGPKDAADDAAALSQREEHNALIEALESERARIARQLGEE
ncbi:hypothetical protein DP939_25430 [Spongiactinospora rosea]|uniref:Uncharacterized protein n=1 Tax=Spongiactinospora rosea TaxID=2248750 RepID=A0A366LVE0_9ACTN|nr:hypothetical protein [Spongiactinospora rosea]RBQ17284.1 hypothetical protein DP939_25430 [Spongiactinospora rosea]